MDLFDILDPRPSKMRVLVACEFSGIVRDAFIKKGHDAVSCDIQTALSAGPHVQGDVRPLLKEPHDLVIAHPPCTYLCNSGVRWLDEDIHRWEEMEKAAEFFLECFNANTPRVAVENPIMHRYARHYVGLDPNFTVQPYEHGHGESKATCFWTRGLPELKPSNIVEGRDDNIRKLFWARKEERKALRSIFYEGIAKAMADQWG